MKHSPVSRRHFLTAALAGGTVSSSQIIAAEANSGFNKPARDLPLTNDADVIECGAGPAGVAAAIRPPHTPSPLHVQGQLDPGPSKAIS